MSRTHRHVGTDHDDRALIDTPPLQVEAAIRDAMDRAALLVIECPPAVDRTALSEHFLAQARAANSAFAQEGRAWVDGYLNLAGHPLMPAESFVCGRASLWDDLADGVASELARARLAIVDAPEELLVHSPLRFGRFLAACLVVRSRAGLMVVLTAYARLVLALLGDCDGDWRTLSDQIVCGPQLVSPEAVWMQSTAAAVIDAARGTGIHGRRSPPGHDPTEETE